MAGLSISDDIKRAVIKRQVERGERLLPERRIFPKRNSILIFSEALRDIFPTMVFPAGYDEEKYAGEVLVNSKYDVLEVRGEPPWESWHPADDFRAPAITEDALPGILNDPYYNDPDNNGFDDREHIVTLDSLGMHMLGNLAHTIAGRHAAQSSKAIYGLDRKGLIS